jgi:hypothetical protein
LYVNEGKTGPFWGWILMGMEVVNGEGEGRQIWWMYFVYMYENRK